MWRECHVVRPAAESAGASLRLAGITKLPFLVCARFRSDAPADVRALGPHRRARRCPGFHKTGLPGVGGNQLTVLVAATVNQCRHGGRKRLRCGGSALASSVAGASIILCVVVWSGGRWCRDRIGAPGWRLLAPYLAWSPSNAADPRPERLLSPEANLV